MVRASPDSRARRQAARWSSGGISGFRTGQVEGDHALSREPGGSLRHGERITLGSERRHDEGLLEAGVGRTAGEAGQDGFECVLVAHAPAPVQAGPESHLGVDDAVGMQVDDAFVGHSLQAFRRLEDAHRVPERVEILDEVARICLVEPIGEALLVRRRELVVRGLRCQLEHSERPEPAVDMVVQHRLGQGAEIDVGHGGRA